MARRFVGLVVSEFRACDASARATHEIGKARGDVDTPDCASICHGYGRRSPLDDRTRRCAPGDREHLGWPGCLRRCRRSDRRQAPLRARRTSTPALVARALSGALCGAALARREHAEPFLAVALGAIGAMARSCGGYTVRRYLTKERGLSDLLIALVEDTIAIVLARNAAA